MCHLPVLLCVCMLFLGVSVIWSSDCVHYHLCCTSCRGGFQQTWCCPSELHHCFDRFMYLHAWCRLDHLYHQGRCRQHLRVVHSLSRRCSRCGQPQKNSLLPIHLRPARCGRCTCTGGWPPAMVSLQSVYRSLWHAGSLCVCGMDPSTVTSILRASDSMQVTFRRKVRRYMQGVCE